jgi:hypothetical protein
MQATIEFVSGYVGQQINQLELAPPVSFAIHAKLIPALIIASATSASFPLP